MCFGSAQRKDRQDGRQRHKDLNQSRFKNQSNTRYQTKYQQNSYDEQNYHHNGQQNNYRMNQQNQNHQTNHKRNMIIQSWNEGTGFNNNSNSSQIPPPLNNSQNPPINNQINNLSLVDSILSTNQPQHRWNYHEKFRDQHHDEMNHEPIQANDWPQRFKKKIIKNPSFLQILQDFWQTKKNFIIFNIVLLFLIAIGIIIFAAIRMSKIHSYDYAIISHQSFDQSVLVPTLNTQSQFHKSKLISNNHQKDEQLTSGRLHNQVHQGQKSIEPDANHHGTIKNIKLHHAHQLKISI